MDHATQVRLLGRVLELVAGKTTDMVDDVVEHPVAAYHDPRRHDREVTAILRRAPIPIARSSDLPEPGDFATHDASGLPILVARGTDGALRAMLNVCRHRGTRVVAAERGCKTSFVCPYHAWTYACDGRLTRITDDVGFPGVDRDQRGLVQLPLQERHGFVWVSGTPGAAIDVETWLGPVGDDLASWGIATHVAYQPRTMRQPMSWKLAIDVFLEAYHVRYVHGRSIYPLFFDNVALFERVGRHQRNVFPKRTVSELAGTDPATWRLRERANVLYQIFPSSLLLVQPDHASFFTVFPDGTDACHIAGLTLLPEAPTTEKAHAYWGKNIDILWSAVSEDLTMATSIQRGLRSGANDTFLYGRYEQSLRWFHGAIDEALAEGEHR